MICFFCGAKILNSEIYKKQKIAHISQCSRFIYLLHCNKCNKKFDYKYLQKHKELFKNTLILIGVLNAKWCKMGKTIDFENSFEIA
jgi:hypothetical protein